MCATHNQKYIQVVMAKEPTTFKTQNNEETFSPMAKFTTV